MGDRGSEFYNTSMESFLQNNDIEMYSMHNEEKSLIAGTVIRTLKNKVYKYMIQFQKMFILIN